MEKANMHIRKAAKKAGVYLWQVATELGISEPTMHRWLRTPLNKEKEEQIMEIINRLGKENENA